MKPYHYLLLLVTLVLASGCGQGSVSTEAEVSVQKGGYKIEGADYSQSVGSQAELPVGFPADLPIYPGARLAFGQAAVGIFTVSWVADDELSKVKAFYSQNLPAQGWQMDGVSDFGGQVVITASKGGRQAMLGLELSKDVPAGGQTRISLNLTSS